MTKADATAQFLAELRKKVESGSIGTAEAEKLAVIALQEVMETPSDEGEGEGEQAAGAEEESKEITPAPSAVDPKTQILSLLTKFQGQIAPSIKQLQAQLNEIVKGTSGPAVPLGDFNVGSDDHAIRIGISEGDQAAVEYILSVKDTWTQTGVQIAASASAPSGACHLGLRKELFAMTEELLERTESTLRWKRSKVPLEELKKLSAEAKKADDKRVVEVVTAAPTNVEAREWKQWALASQVYLLGPDYSASERKTFTQIKASL